MSTICIGFLADDGIPVASGSFGNFGLDVKDSEVDAVCGQNCSYSVLYLHVGFTLLSVDSWHATRSVWVPGTVAVIGSFFIGIPRWEIPGVATTRSSAKRP